MEYRIIELKDKLIAYAQTEPQEIKRMENESERDVWDTMERSNFFSLKSSQGRGEREWGSRIFEEIMVENFPVWLKILIYTFKNLWKPQIRINTKNTIPGHVKLLKTKEKI